MFYLSHFNFMEEVLGSNDLKFTRTCILNTFSNFNST